ncbi:MULTISPECIES: gp53-like domain-containing protein [Pseudomonas]|uniref:gp53-like domain-containing protein n=1 Tax=Pseudomonas TaxID=286 RepID=UPI0021177600|nr:MULTISPECIES: hypothetical protein [Pseudomonas]
MSRADSFAVNDKAVQDFVLEGEITEAEITAGAAQGKKWFSLRRLLFGFVASFTTNGYIVFPWWLGGWIFQWGQYTSGATANAAVPVSFPLAFKAYCLQVHVSPQVNSSTGGDARWHDPTLTGFSARSSYVNATISYYAVGR